MSNNVDWLLPFLLRCRMTYVVLDAHIEQLRHLLSGILPLVKLCAEYAAAYSDLCRTQAVVPSGGQYGYPLAVDLVDVNPLLNSISVSQTLAPNSWNDMWRTRSFQVHDKTYVGCSDSVQNSTIWYRLDDGRHELVHSHLEHWIGDTRSYARPVAIGDTVYHVRKFTTIPGRHHIPRSTGLEIDKFSFSATDVNDIKHTLSRSFLEDQQLVIVEVIAIGSLLLIVVNVEVDLHTRWIIVYNTESDCWYVAPVDPLLNVTHGHFVVYRDRLYSFHGMHVYRTEHPEWRHVWSVPIHWIWDFTDSRLSKNLKRLPTIDWRAAQLNGLSMCSLSPNFQQPSDLSVQWTYHSSVHSVDNRIGWVENDQLYAFGDKLRFEQWDHVKHCWCTQTYTVPSTRVHVLELEGEH